MTFNLDKMVADLEEALREDAKRQLFGYAPEVMQLLQDLILDSSLPKETRERAGQIGAKLAFQILRRFPIGSQEIQPNDRASLSERAERLSK